MKDETINCPLAGSGRLGCRCTIPRRLDMKLIKVKDDQGARPIEQRLRLLRRFRDQETLSALAAEEGVSVKRMHEIVHKTWDKVRKACRTAEFIDEGKRNG